MSIPAPRGHLPALMLILIVALACNIPSAIGEPAAASGDETASSADLTAQAAAAPTLVPPIPTAEIVHSLTPSDAPPAGKLVYDVESSSTAAEERAPYGDSYDINRLERPFLQDMTYVPDLDIVSYTVSSDANFWYVSIELIGSDPNNSLGIHYGIELDLDHDGFGDYSIRARPPYATTWDTLPVEIYQDTNHDTGGLSGEKSDAPIESDGYETLIFNGGKGDADPDMAWVRVNAGPQATVQFAFKSGWSGSVFMLGVLSDAGLRDSSRLDYVDRFTEADAGSPVKDKSYYPLGELFAVDNACREAFGFGPTGYEPQLCPPGEPQPRPNGTPGEPSGCQPPGGSCPPGYWWWPDPHCACSITPYNP